MAAAPARTSNSRSPSRRLTARPGPCLYCTRNRGLTSGRVLCSAGRGLRRTWHHTRPVSVVLAQVGDGDHGHEQPRDQRRTDQWDPRPVGADSGGRAAFTCGPPGWHVAVARVLRRAVLVSHIGILPSDSARRYAALGECFVWSALRSRAMIADGMAGMDGHLFRVRPDRPTARRRLAERLSDYFRCHGGRGLREHQAADHGWMPGGEPGRSPPRPTARWPLHPGVTTNPACQPSLNPGT